MKIMHALTGGLVFLSSLGYAQEKPKAIPFESIKERLGNYADVFKQDAKILKEKYGFEEKDYYLSVSPLHIQEKDTLYFLNPLEDKVLESLREKNPKEKIYSVKLEDHLKLNADNVANFIYDKAVGVDEEEGVREINVLNSILSVYPNPTNSTSNIILELPFSASTLKGAIYDIQGKEVKKLNLEYQMGMGRHRLSYEFDKNLASGFYLLRIEGSSQDKYFVASKKILLLK